MTMCSLDSSVEGRHAQDPEPRPSKAEWPGSTHEPGVGGGQGADSLELVPENQSLSA